MMPNIAKELPDLGYLRECFDLDEATGKLTWLARPESHFNTEHACTAFNGKMAGKAAGARHSRGYMVVKVSRTPFYVHRLIYYLHKSEPPPVELQIDHVNGDKIDNRPSNLRLATNGQNGMNRVKIVGCYFHKKRQTYHARIWLNREQIDLGHFPDIIEAHAAYLAAKQIYHGEFAPAPA